MLKRTTHIALVAAVGLAVAAHNPAPVTKPYNPKIDPADFGGPVDNPYLPLKPGTVNIVVPFTGAAPLATEVAVKPRASWFEVVNEVITAKALPARSTVTGPDASPQVSILADALQPVPVPRSGEGAAQASAA